MNVVLNSTTGSRFCRHRCWISWLRRRKPSYRK